MQIQSNKKERMYSKMKYEKPELEVITFETKDVIITSMELRPNELPIIPLV